MSRDIKSVPAGNSIILLLVLINAIAIKEGFTGDEKWYRVLIPGVPLLLLAIANTRYAILRRAMVIGWFRHLFKRVRLKYTGLSIFSKNS
jgi:hypothetical protein